MAQLGHHVLGKLHDFGVPTFVFINGLALGGGLEIPLNADYRTVDASAAGLALPEVFLGIIPGWGGAWLLPNLIGIENALKVVIENPLKHNRMLKPKEAFELGIVDAMFALGELPRGLRQVGRRRDHRARPRSSARTSPARSSAPSSGMSRSASPRRCSSSRIGKVAESPYKALELLKAAKSVDRTKGFALEDEALADLISGDQFQASIYAFNLVQKRAKRPAGAPDKAIARPVTKVGVIGAGLMARQFALLFVRRLQVPVVITDLDQGRVDEGVAWIHNEIADLLDEGPHLATTSRTDSPRSSPARPNKADFATCDWVIEAIFEELDAKQKVFAEVEQYITPETILATNTSSLSVEQIGAKLKHPERVVGFHFFNPVAVMPLIEVVKTPKTNDETLSTAMVTAEKLRKNAVITRDTPGFVVNRVLAKVLGEAMHAVDTGTPFEVVEEAARPFGLPMTPFELLELVGLKVGAHVLDTHHAAFPDRFFESENLHKLAELGHIFERDGKGKIKGIDKKALAIVKGGTTPMTAKELQTRLEDGLADEIHRMLEDDVVAAAEDIDLCMILGAGYPFQMGGVTPYLDRVGASERAFGGTFHTPPIRGVQ